MPDVFLRAGEANPSDVKLRDTTIADSGANTTGTIATSQAVQSGAIVAIERYVAAVAATQAVQTGAIAGTERLSGTIAGTQGVQTGASSGTERYLATVATSQPAQSGALAAREAFTATIAGSQAAQTGAITGSTAVNTTGTIAATQAAQTGSLVAVAPAAAEERLRHGARFDRIATRSKREKPVLQPVLAVIGGVQSSQRSRIAARTNDDDLAYLYLELAA